MRASLTGQLLEVHRAGASAFGRAAGESLEPGPGATAGGSGREEENEILLRPDHVLLEGGEGRVTLGAFMALEAKRIRTDLALIGLEGIHAAQGARTGRDMERVARAARGVGCHVTEAERRGCEPVYHERFAAPGKLAIAVGRGAPLAGALGALVLRAEALEAATILAGRPWWVRRPGVLGVRLEGRLSPWVSGADLALALARQMPPGWRSRFVIEFGGRGTAGVSMRDRHAMVSEAEALGAMAALFPSDEATRRHLQAVGREPDWKPLGPADDARFDRELALDLDTLEPLIAAEEDLAGARAVRHAMGMPVARVIIGGRATLEDLARLALILGGRRIHAATELTVVPGSRALVEAAGGEGVLAALEAAGARIVDASLPPDLGWSSSAGAVGLCMGTSGEHHTGRRTAWFVASLESCAAAALAGCVVDPRELEDVPARESEPMPRTAARSWILEPVQDGAADPESRAERPPTVRPLEAPPRGAVLLEVGDRVRAATILPFGARQQSLLGNWDALATYAFAPLDPDFAARALRHGGGFVIAGHELGAGEPGELAALVLAALEVRAILARSFAPGFARRLVHAGVLPLEFRHPADSRAITAGDELEIPSLPGALEPGKALNVRNLTRGTQLALGHGLDPRRIQIVRAGGLLALAALEAPGTTARSRV